MTSRRTIEASTTPMLDEDEFPPSQPAKKVQKSITVQASKTNLKKTTKTPPDQPQAKLAVSNFGIPTSIVIPKIALNGSEINYIEPENTYKREETKKLNALENGETIEIERWKQISSRFGNGVTHVLYSKPDEEGNEQAYWSISIIDNYIQNHKPDMESVAFSVTKIEDNNFKVGIFNKG